MIGHHLQALLNVGLTDIQRAILTGTLRQFEKLRDLQLGLKLLLGLGGGFARGLRRAAGLDLGVEFGAQCQQFGMIGNLLQTLFNAGETVLQGTGLLLLPGAGQQAFGFGALLGRWIDCGWRDDQRHRWWCGVLL
jgi:hypothetical protein